MFHIHAPKIYIICEAAYMIRNTSLSILTFKIGLCMHVAKRHTRIRHTTLVAILVILYGIWIFVLAYMSSWTCFVELYTHK